MNDQVDKEAVIDALQELEYLASCRCDIAWTGRGLHETHCSFEYRVDVQTVASAIEQAWALEPNSTSIHFNPDFFADTADEVS